MRVYGINKCLSSKGLKLTKDVNKFCTLLTHLSQSNSLYFGSRVLDSVPQRHNIYISQLWLFFTVLLGIFIWIISTFYKSLRKHN